MSTASFPAAVWLLTLIAGYRARPGSSSRCECCRGCSAVASSKSFRVLIAPGNLSSSASTSIWPTARPSPTGSALCVSASGWSTPSAPSPDPRRCLPICRATRTESAISNSRLIANDDRGVTFRWKDYREQHGRTRYKTMTVATDEFMRRFLLHVLPSGFRRIRHYGLLANANRQRDIPAVRELLHQPPPQPAAEPSADSAAHSIRPTFVCRHCGAPMLVIETFARAQYIRGPSLCP